jgi:hypothetical protein
LWYALPLVTFGKPRKDLRRRGVARQTEGNPRTGDERPIVDKGRLSADLWGELIKECPNENKVGRTYPLGSIDSD